MNTDIAQVVLTNYDIPGAQLTFIGQSQNTTFRVETSTGDRFLLRLHSGIETTGDRSTDVWREARVIESELLWLNAITQDTNIIVPKPIQNRFGEWVTSFTQTEMGIKFPCSLLRWVDGDHLSGEPTPLQIKQLGMLMARLHQHSSSWSLPSRFSRPIHDTEQIKLAASQLGILVQNKIISVDHYQLFQTAATQVQKFMAELQQSDSTWGLIHADLHQGNYLFYGQEIRPIDFSRCGFGFYLYDIGQAVGDMDAALRSHFFEGYTHVRSLPSNYQSIVEAFFVGATVENFAFLSSNPHEYEWLSRAVPYVVENHLCSYLDGEHFLFTK
jgi:Ser/Thr protein kinase RdoA (MazF antagonist)